jgi:hypothetical protein
VEKSLVMSAYKGSELMGSALMQMKQQKKSTIIMKNASFLGDKA